MIVRRVTLALIHICDNSAKKMRNSRMGQMRISNQYRSRHIYLLLRTTNQDFRRVNLLQLPHNSS